MTLTRPVGKYGLLPGHVPDSLHDLTWYAAGVLSRAPSEVEPPAPGKAGDWGMDGNDTVGDCGVAGFHHGDMAVSDDTATPQLPVTADELVQYYLTYTGGQDNGVVLADFLAYVQQNNFFGRKVAGYAPVSIADFATLQFTVNAYGYAYCGIQVTDRMEQAFSDSTPWTASMFTHGNVQGGHCVPLVGYDDTSLYCVTWGRVQAILYSAWHLISMEAWAVIMGEVPASGLDKHGVSLVSLSSDLTRLSR